MTDLHTTLSLPPELWTKENERQRYERYVEASRRILELEEENTELVDSRDYWQSEARNDASELQQYKDAIEWIGKISKSDDGYYVGNIRFIRGNTLLEAINKAKNGNK